MTGRTLWLASVVAVGAALGWIGAAAEPTAASDWERNLPPGKTVDAVAGVRYKAALPGDRKSHPRRDLYRISLDGQECVIATLDLRIDAISCDWGGGR